MATERFESPEPAQLFEHASDFAPIDAASPRLTPQPAIVSGWRYQPTSVKFDPSKHLAIEEPEWIKKLSDFGFDDTTDGISPVAASAPFRLFSDDAVRLLRNDLLSEPVQTKHVFSSNRSPCVVRGYAPEVSRFVYDAWTHPEVIAAISKVAGLDLVPWFDYDIASTNIQLGPRGHDGVRELEDIPTPPLYEGTVEKSAYDDRPVDDWHYDGVPFVAVLMISDTRGMKGGETAVMCKDGSVQVVPGPAMGKVVVMQGSKLRHAALRAQNCSERIAMVTSLRPRDPFVEDMSHLRNVSNISDCKKLGHQWLEYRLKVLEERFRIQGERLEAAGPRALLEDEMASFASECSQYLSHTMKELADMKLQY